jgi:ribosomal protein L11
LETAVEFCDLQDINTHKKNNDGINLGVEVINNNLKSMTIKTKKPSLKREGFK